MIPRYLSESFIFAYGNYDTYFLLALNVRISVLRKRRLVAVAPVDAVCLRRTSDHRGFTLATYEGRC